MCAIDYLEANAAQLIPAVQDNARRFRTAAAAIPQLAVVGGDAAAISPVVHLALHPAPLPAEVSAACCQAAKDCLCSAARIAAWGSSAEQRLKAASFPPRLQVPLTATAAGKALSPVTVWDWSGQASGARAGSQ